MIMSKHFFLILIIFKPCYYTNVFFQLYAEKVATRGLCAIAQCESLRYKLIGGLAVRR